MSINALLRAYRKVSAQPEASKPAPQLVNTLEPRPPNKIVAVHNEPSFLTVWRLIVSRRGYGRQTSKAVGAWTGSRPLILRGEHIGLQTHIAATESVLSCMPIKY